MFVRGTASEDAERPSVVIRHRRTLFTPSNAFSNILETSVAKSAGLFPAVTNSKPHAYPLPHAPTVCSLKPLPHKAATEMVREEDRNKDDEHSGVGVEFPTKTSPSNTARLEALERKQPVPQSTRRSVN